MEEQLKDALFSVMTPREIEQLLNEMFEAYVSDDTLSHDHISDSHFIKRKLIELINILYNK